MPEIMQQMNVITTFDGVEHNRDELLEKMQDDDFYYGYMGEQALSSSTIKTLIKSPKLYQEMLKNGSDESQPLRDGKLFHLRILEPEKFKALNVVDVASRNTNVFRIAVAEFGESYTVREIEKAEQLAEILLANDAAMELLDGGNYEIPEVQIIEGIPFRGKADIVNGKQIIDIKTTAEIKKFKWSAQKFGYDLQAYLYLQLFPDAERFTFLCIDKNSKDIAIFECSDEFLEKGKSKLEKGIEDYKFFFQQETDIDQYVIRDTLFPPY